MMVMIMMHDSPTTKNVWEAIDEGARALFCQAPTSSLVALKTSSTQCGHSSTMDECSFKQNPMKIFLQEQPKKLILILFEILSDF